MTANTLRDVATRVKPPTAWDDPDRYLRMMGSDWGRALVLSHSALTSSTALFWAERGVHAVHLPVTTGAVSSPMGLGSDSTPVPVDLMGAPTYLADSMQFLLEYALRITDSGCYYVMPSFRGEAPDDSHLCQFFHSEAELPGSLDQLMPVVEAYVRRLSEDMLERCADEVLAVAGTLDHLQALVEREAAFEQISFEEAVRLVGDDPKLVRHHEASGARWRTLTRAGEREVMKRVGQFTWVTGYDHLSVPFYQAFGEDSNTAINADLLFGLGEVVGAGERHRDVKATRAALALHQVPEEDYAWYVAMREEQPLQTSGFGLGVERYLMWALQHWDIRDLQLLNRVNGEVHNP